MENKKYYFYYKIGVGKIFILNFPKHFLCLFVPQFTLKSTQKVGNRVGKIHSGK